MNNIKFVRVDHRLIHGQVITKWMKLVQANKIIIVDDILGQDPFMVDIYQMAAPAGVTVEIVDTDKVADLISQDDYQSDRIFLLFKDIQSVKSALSHGLNLTSIQLGGVPFEQGRTKVATAVALLPSEFAFLKEVNDSGCEVYVQIVPEEAKISFADIAKNF